MKSYSGVVNIFDAHLLFFPVRSVESVVWVTTPERMTDAGFDVSVPSEWDGSGLLLTWERQKPLNLGWLMLGVQGKVDITPPETLSETERWTAVRNRIVVTDERKFSHLVNSNLEVRTSVSIEPETGAAKEGALFTYEAIPRASFMTVEVILDDYRGGGSRVFPAKRTAKGHDLPFGPWNEPLDVVDAGMRAMEWLGIGGMGTRGFGRIAVIGRPTETDLLQHQVGSGGGH